MVRYPRDGKCRYCKELATHGTLCEKHRNQQGSAEWIQERLGRFTASEIHKLIPSGKGGQPFSDTGKTYILEIS